MSTTNIHVVSHCVLGWFVIGTDGMNSIGTLEVVSLHNYIKKILTKRVRNAMALEAG
jgi:hypothetical protein